MISEIQTHHITNTSQKCHHLSQFALWNCINCIWTPYRICAKCLRALNSVPTYRDAAVQEATSWRRSTVSPLLSGLLEDSDGPHGAQGLACTQGELYEMNHRRDNPEWRQRILCHEQEHLLLKSASVFIACKFRDNFTFLQGMYGNTFLLANENLEKVSGMQMMTSIFLYYTKFLTVITIYKTNQLFHTVIKCTIYPFLFHLSVKDFHKLLYF